MKSLITSSAPARSLVISPFSFFIDVAVVVGNMLFLFIYYYCYSTSL